MHGRLTRVVLGIDIRTRANQELDDVFLLGVQGGVQSRPPAVKGQRVDVGAGGEQHLDRLYLAVVRGDRESGHSVERPVRISAKLEKVLHPVSLTIAESFAEFVIQIVQGLFGQLRLGRWSRLVSFITWGSAVVVVVIKEVSASHASLERD